MTPAGLPVTVAERVARAVVRLPRLIGQGVLVPGGFIVTAARCIDWTAEDSMTPGGFCLNPSSLRTAARSSLRPWPSSRSLVWRCLARWMIKPSPGRPRHSTFCEATPPVRLAIQTLRPFVPLPASVFTHDRGVISAIVRLVSPGSASLWLHSDCRISGGTSGGPVVTDDGRLWELSPPSVGTEEEPCQGAIPRVHLAGPAWLVRQMVSANARRKSGAALLPPGRRPRLQPRSRNR